MGSSLSPVLANIYMEYFEIELLKDIPMDMRPTLWLRYVDDVFCCFKDMSKFPAFLERLNSIRPSIQFTYELSRIDSTAEGLPDLPVNVMESLPFLELNVMRLNNGRFTFSIYRKPCHAGNYIHAYSYQPLAQKTTVVRSLYLRAYRFCDKQFLTEEENTIQQSFLKLGYTSKFIDKCKSSAYKGRLNEIKKDNLLVLQELPFSRQSITLTEKQKPLATLTLPYHPCMLKLRSRLNEMGIRLAFSSNSKLQQLLRRKSAIVGQPKGSVYVVNCSSCPLVYVGQTGKQAEDRMVQHSREPSNDSSVGAVTKHNKLDGHIMDLRNPTRVYSSDCHYTRVTVEAALIHAAPTIPHNKASASNDSNDLVAPVICRATKFNWNKLAHCMPSLNEDAIPRYKRPLFGPHPIVRPPVNMRSQAPIPVVSYNTRLRSLARSIQQGS